MKCSACLEKQRCEDCGVVIDNTGKVFDLTTNIDQLIAAKFHEKLGMTEAAYRGSWPKTAVQPPAYAGRFDTPLLVDTTIKEFDYNFWVKREGCEDLVTREMPARYIAWTQLDKYIDKSVEEVRGLLHGDEVELTVSEGLMLPVQCENHLRKYAVDLCGSRFGSSGAPYVVWWFGHVRPGMDARGVGGRDPGYGSGSRGIEVISVG